MAESQREIVFFDAIPRRPDLEQRLVGWNPICTIRGHQLAYIRARVTNPYSTVSLIGGCSRCRKALPGRVYFDSIEDMRT